MSTCKAVGHFSELIVSVPANSSWAVKILMFLQDFCESCCFPNLLFGGDDIVGLFVLCLNLITILFYIMVLRDKDEPNRGNRDEYKVGLYHRSITDTTTILNNNKQED